MKDIRIEEIKFMPEINQIIKDNFRLFPQDITNVELSTSNEDTKESFDIVYKSKVEISVRIRDNSYLNYSDFTIRSRSLYGNETELDKLIKGKGNIYLYSWKDKLEQKFEAWILVDINKIRNMFTEYQTKNIRNYDGTAFKAYPIKELINYDGLINKYGLPDINIINQTTSPKWDMYGFLKRTLNE